MTLMFVRKPGLSWRGRLPLVATFLLLMGAIIAAPGVSNAAAVKQYLSKISPTATSGNSTGASFTVTITDCGGNPLQPPCTLASTIQLGTAQILVPTRFSSVRNVAVSSTVPSARHWSASWDGTYIQAKAVTGNDKLNAGESVNVTFDADVEGCSTTGSPYEFTTTAWASTPTHTGQTFTPLQQPTVTINGCTLTSGGDPVPGPNGTDVTGTGFEGTVNVSFGGTLTCGDNAQWNLYHLPDVVTIDPADVTSSTVKTFTFTFDATNGVDSSWYLICYSSNLSATTGTVLLPCYNEATGATRTEPCVSEQFRTLPTSSNPNKIVISMRVPPEDPRAH